jgi:hypothetical protein
MRLTSLIAVLSLAVLACRSDNNNTPDGQGSGSGSNSGTTVKDVQSDTMVPGTAVTLNNVVVTAIDSFGTKTGDLWVEDMGGGKRSGVHVFKATAPGVAIGDVVNITGAIKAEFALTGSNADNTGRTTTELEPASSSSTLTVTKTGATATITPDKVDALAIGQLYDSTMFMAGGGAAFSNAWEDWEGVLVELDNVSAASAARGFGMKPFAPDAYAVNLTGVAKLEGTMTDITMSSIKRGTCFGQITGVVDYFFNYLVLPRSSADFNTTGTACPQAESACADSIDNDGNGFTDCADNGCIVNAASCRSTSTINAIDTATTLPTTGQELGSSESVCVTAVANNGQDFWIAKGPGVASANNGLYVFADGAVLGTGLVATTKVDVIGTPKLFNNDTTGNSVVQFNGLAATAQTGACSVTALPGQTAANLSIDANGKPMIGSLVQMTNVAVVTIGISASHFAGTMKQAGTTFEYQSDILTADYTAADVKCYATVTGIWSYDVFTNAYSIEPLQGGAVGVGTCT